MDPHTDEHLIFKRSEWGPTYYVAEPADLVFILDDRLAEFTRKFAFYEGTIHSSLLPRLGKEDFILHRYNSHEILSFNRQVPEQYREPPRNQHREKAPNPPGNTPPNAAKRTPSD